MSSPALLFLIGYRGTGKSTVGRLVADRLGWAFADADAELEADAGRTIAAIFAAEGEGAFRDREEATLARLSAPRDHVVVATGGGVVLRPANRDRLRAGFVAWLAADPETLIARLAADPHTPGRRPALTATGGADEVRALIAAREPLYREVADVRVETTDVSPDAVADAILLAWNGRSTSR